MQPLRNEDPNTDSTIRERLRRENISFESLDEVVQKWGREIKPLAEKGNKEHGVAIRLGQKPPAGTFYSRRTVSEYRSANYERNYFYTSPYGEEKLLYSEVINPNNDTVMSVRLYIELPNGDGVVVSILRDINYSSITATDSTQSQLYSYNSRDGNLGSVPNQVLNILNSEEAISF